MSKKKIIVICILLLLLFIAGIVYLLIPKTTLTFKTAPGEVSVKIDSIDKGMIKNGSSIRIQPGEHTIRVSRPEFDSYTKKITIQSGQTQEFLVALTPQTEAARKLLEDQVSQAIIQQFKGVELLEATDVLNKKYPILKDLPINARLYTVYMCPSEKYPDDKTRLAVCVDIYHEGLEPYVEKDLRSRGYELSDFEVIWKKAY